jgi:thiol-disulfide isomerase/thioredoxin
VSRPRLQTIVLLAVAILAGAAGFYFSNRQLLSPTTRVAAKRLMLTSLRDTGGRLQRLSQWRNNVLIVNFWATWCLPCREEIPALVRVNHKYAANGVYLVGIAVDDTSKVLEYARELGIDYMLLIGGTETLALTADLGNRTELLPFTVVLNRAGTVVYTHAGAVDEATLGAILSPML